MFEAKGFTEFITPSHPLLTNHIAQQFLNLQKLRFELLETAFHFSYIKNTWNGNLQNLLW
jgi:hypothetical protein